MPRLINESRKDYNWEFSRYFEVTVHDMLVKWGYLAIMTFDTISTLETYFYKEYLNI